MFTSFSKQKVFAAGLTVLLSITGCGHFDKPEEPVTVPSLSKQIVDDNAENLAHIVTATGRDLEMGRRCLELVAEDVDDATLGHQVRKTAEQVDENWSVSKEKDNSIWDKALTISIAVLVILLALFPMMRNWKNEKSNTQNR